VPGGQAEQNRINGRKDIEEMANTRLRALEGDRRLLAYDGGEG
jgi:hypothetical protein